MKILNIINFLLILLNKICLRLKIFYIHLTIDIFIKNLIFLKFICFLFTKIKLLN